MFSLVFLPLRACAACPLAIFISLSPLPAFSCTDHPDHDNPVGVRCHRYAVSSTLLLASTGGAFFLGAEDRFGKSFRHRQGTASAAEETKHTTHLASIRWRALETGNVDHHPPNRQTSDTAALVTPFILSYKDNYPAVWLLASLPAYEMATQMKGSTQRPKDVLTGAVLGGMKGYYEHKDGSWVFRLRPRGVFVGYRKLLK